MASHFKNWYAKCRAEIEKLYGDDADLFCDLLAATSPRKHVKANWKLADYVYKTRDTSRCLPAHKKNIERAFSGEPLSGRKVRAFAANLKGDLTKVTVDVWICRYFGVEKLNSRLYDVIETIIKVNAIVEDKEPAELQAEIWCEALEEAGRKPISFISAIDYQLKLF